MFRRCFSILSDFTTTAGSGDRTSLLLGLKETTPNAKAFSTRMKALHIINAPSYAEVFLAITKAVFSSKLTSRVRIFLLKFCNYLIIETIRLGIVLKRKKTYNFQIFVHGKDLTNFSKQVPRMCLPDDLGGTGGSLQENWGKYSTITTSSEY
ncbi:hypothetical protein ANN_26392 [Periplaneta americana]|uniref:CRAL-TRIO domain-containing protein n=1 Tax=Periplaneta americana TaxID=6978 RepID=A0ABQ8RY29_PERAM|nr:hypothetical protein ANN_26392 [Periplaneta americana]